MVEDFDVVVHYYYDPELRKICLNCNLINQYIECFWSICRKYHITFSETYDEVNFAYNRKILENLCENDLKYTNTDKTYKGNIRPSCFVCDTIYFIQWWYDVIANDLIYDIVYNISLHNNRWICHGFSITLFGNTFEIFLPSCPYKQNRHDYKRFFSMLGINNMCPICHMCRIHWYYDEHEHKNKYICNVEHKIYQQAILHSLSDSVKNYEYIIKQLDDIQHQLNNLQKNNNIKYFNKVK